MIVCANAQCMEEKMEFLEENCGKVPPIPLPLLVRPSLCELYRSKLKKVYNGMSWCNCKRAILDIRERWVFYLLSDRDRWASVIWLTVYSYLGDRSVISDDMFPCRPNDWVISTHWSEQFSLHAITHPRRYDIGLLPWFQQRKLALIDVVLQLKRLHFDTACFEINREMSFQDV